MIKYKLTTQDLKTHNGFQWEIGKTVTVDGNGELCSEHKLHYYHHPLLAILLNPIHANIQNPRLWKVECGEEGHIDDDGLKGGCNSMTLIEELPIPVITLTQKIAFGILCSLAVYQNIDVVSIWASNWLQNVDRTKKAAAYTANYAAKAAVKAAADYAADYAAKVAANYAAKAAAHADYAADYAAIYAAHADYAADYAAIYAAKAANAAVAAKSINTINLIDIATEAMLY